MQALRDRRRLAEAVLDRRSLLGLSQEEFAQRGELNVKTVQRVEKGEISPRAKTLGGLDRAAEWEPGSARRTLEGGAPTPIGATSQLEREIQQIRSAHAQGLIDTALAERLEEKVRRDYETSPQVDTDSRFGRRHG